MSTSISSKNGVESENEDEEAGDIVITNDFTVGDVNVVEVSLIENSSIYCISAILTDCETVSLTYV